MQKYNMKGIHKKFDKILFNKYDIPAREKIKKFLGSFVCDNPDPYKQDFIITDENCKYKYIEIQVCTNWLGEKFPFDNVFIYERKYHYGEDTLFITLNKNLTKGLIFDASSFKKSKPRRLKKYSREYVYDVPWYRILPFAVDCLDIEVIKLY